MITLNVAIPRDFSDTEHMDFALDSSMFFYKYLFCYLTNLFIYLLFLFLQKYGFQMITLLMVCKVFCTHM